MISFVFQSCLLAFSLSPDGAAYDSFALVVEVVFYITQVARVFDVVGLEHAQIGFICLLFFADEHALLGVGVPPQALAVPGSLFGLAWSVFLGDVVHRVFLLLLLFLLLNVVANLEVDDGSIGINIEMVFWRELVVIPGVWFVACLLPLFQIFVPILDLLVKAFFVSA